MKSVEVEDLRTPICPPLTNSVRCTQSPGHTKAVQAITHHGLS